MARLTRRSQPPLGQVFTLNRDSIQAAGLGPWWPTLGARGAGILRDASGLDYTGTLTNGPVWIGDPLLGAAIDLDNTNDYVDLGSSTTVLTSGQPFTLCWWELARTSSGNYPSRFRLPISGHTESFLALRAAVGTGFEYLDFGPGGAAVTGVRATDAPTLPNSVGVWNHFAIVGLVGPENNTTTNYRAYCNAVLLTLAAAGLQGATGTTTARIGYDGVDDAPNCALADIRVYRRALSAQEVFQISAPQTRWELYRPSKWRTIVQGAAAAPAGRLIYPSKLDGIGGRLRGA